MYRGIGGRRSLSEQNLHVSARPRKSNVTLDEHSVKFERIAHLRKQRCSSAWHLTRKQDELKSLLDSGASVDRVQKGIALVRAALRN